MSVTTEKSLAQYLRCCLASMTPAVAQHLAASTAACKTGALAAPGVAAKQRGKSRHFYLLYA